MMYRRVTINLSEDEYQRLITQARESYHRTAGGFARSVVLAAMKPPTPAIVGNVAEQLDIFKKSAPSKKSTVNRKARS